MWWGKLGAGTGQRHTYTEGAAANEMQSRSLRSNILFISCQVNINCSELRESVKMIKSMFCVCFPAARVYCGVSLFITSDCSLHQHQPSLLEVEAQTETNSLPHGWKCAFSCCRSKQLISQNKLIKSVGHVCTAEAERWGNYVWKKSACEGGARGDGRRATSGRSLLDWWLLTDPCDCDWQTLTTTLLALASPHCWAQRAVWRLAEIPNKMDITGINNGLPHRGECWAHSTLRSSDVAGFTDSALLLDWRVYGVALSKHLIEKAKMAGGFQRNKFFVRKRQHKNKRTTTWHTVLSKSI